MWTLSAEGSTVTPSMYTTPVMAITASSSMPPIHIRLSDYQCNSMLNGPWKRKATSHFCWKKIKFEKNEMKRNTALRGKNSMAKVLKNKLQREQLRGFKKKNLKCWLTFKTPAKAKQWHWLLGDAGGTSIQHKLFELWCNEMLWSHSAILSVFLSDKAKWQNPVLSEPMIQYLYLQWISFNGITAQWRAQGLWPRDCFYRSPRFYFSKSKSDQSKLKPWGGWAFWYFGMRFSSVRDSWVGCLLFRSASMVEFTRALCIQTWWVCGNILW